MISDFNLTQNQLERFLRQMAESFIAMNLRKTFNLDYLKIFKNWISLKSGDSQEYEYLLRFLIRNLVQNFGQKRNIIERLIIHLNLKWRERRNFSLRFPRFLPSLDFRSFSDLQGHFRV